MYPLMNKLGKVIVVMVTLLFLTINLGMAEQPTSTLEEQHNKCNQVTMLATGIMEARQRGVAMSDVVDAMLTHMKDAPEGLQTITMLMIKQAYAEPRFSTPSNQKSSVTDFANMWYGACMDATLNSD